MTKRDYELVAKVLSQSQGMGGEPFRLSLIYRFSAEFAKANPKFDRAKFLKACNA